MGQMGKADTPGAVGDLAKQGSKMMKQSGKPRKLALKRLTDALSGKKTPQITQAVSASKQQMAGGLAQSAEQLAQRNVGGPFASRMLASQRMSGQQRTGMIPNQMMEQAISQMMPFLASTQSLGAGTLGASAGMQSQIGMSNAANQLAMLQTGTKMGGGAAAGLL